MPLYVSLSLYLSAYWPLTVINNHTCFHGSSRQAIYSALSLVSEEERAGGGGGEREGGLFVPPSASTQQRERREERRGEKCRVFLHSTGGGGTSLARV